MWFDAANQAGTKRNPVDLANARAGISSDEWEIALWSRNLFNEKYSSESVPLLEGVLQAGFRGLPRSYGIEAKIKF